MQPDPKPLECHGWVSTMRQASMTCCLTQYHAQISLLLAIPEIDGESSNASLRFLDLEVDDMTTQVRAQRGVPTRAPW